MLPSLARRLLPVARAAGVQVVHCTAYRRADGKGPTPTPGCSWACASRPSGCCRGRRRWRWSPSSVPSPTTSCSPAPTGSTRWPAPTSIRCSATSASRTIVVTGVSVNVAVTNLVMDAVNRGYDVVLPRRGVRHPADYADAVIDNTLALLATVTTTDELLAIWRVTDAMETGIRGDLEWGTIAALARSAAERFGDAEAVVDGDVRLTFTELAAAAVDAGRAFIAAGVEPGDRVAIWSPQRVGVDRRGARPAVAGGVVVPINTRYKGAEAALPPRPQPGSRARHRQRVPRQRLRRHARRPRPAAPRAHRRAARRRARRARVVGRLPRRR